MLSPRSALVLLLLVVSSPSMAASHWRFLGPHRGNLRTVSALAFDPSHGDRAFAGFESGGIARSDDGGQTWRLMSHGLNGSSIVSITVHPKLGRLVYAVGAPHLFRSLDAGRTWTPLPLQGAFSVAPDPRDPAVVWAATRSGLFRSRDTGQTWERIQANLPQPYRVLSLAVDHLDPQRLYLQIFNRPSRGLWTSGNGGRSWVRRPTVPFGRALYTDLHTAQTLYLVTESRILRSRDAGQTWDRSFLALPEFHYVRNALMAGDPEDPSIFFVPVVNLSGEYDLYRTTDSGRHWRKLTRGLPSELELDTRALAAGRNGTVLLAGENNGFVVFRSVDSGDDWDLVARGISSQEIDTVAVTGSGGLLVGVLGSVERSIDGGATWTTSLPYYFRTTRLVRDPHNPETVYACNQGPHDNPAVVIVWKTVDGGASWAPLPNPVPEDPVVDALDLAIDPADSRMLYLVAGFRLHRSRDGGQTWENIGEPDVYYERVAVSAPGTLLAQANHDGLYRSTDHGNTWTRVLEWDGESPIELVGFSPADADVAYAVSDGILFRSDDGGATFASLGQHVPSGLALDPLDPDTLVFAAPGQGSAFVRLTIGKEREVIRDDDSFVGGLRILAFDPNDPRRLLAESNSGLVEYRFEASP